MRTAIWLALGLICGVVMCLYTVRIAKLPLFPQKQVSGRAYKSDLVPPWAGANALLIQGENPYSSSVSKTIQRIIYSRELRSSDPPGMDQQKFAYPVYALILIAPLAHLRFDTAANVARLTLPVLLLTSTLLWFLMLRITQGIFWAISLVFIFASWPVVQGLALQQLGVLVFFLITLCCYSVSQEQLILGGIFIGLATIKPQVALPLLVWLSIWVVGDFRRRWKLLGSTVSTVALLCLAGELMLRGWIPDWLEALREYASYVPTGSILRMLFGFMGMIAEFCIAALSIRAFWKRRKVPASSALFFHCACLSLSVGLLLSPIWVSHNEISLLPGVLLLWISRRRLTSTLEGGALFYVGAVAQVWSWVGLALLILGLFRPERDVISLGPVTFLLPLVVPASVALLLQEPSLPTEHV